MKVFNTEYKGQIDLEQFIEFHSIAKEKNILLQIFSGVIDTIFIEKLLQELNILIPHIKIIGSSTCGEILDARDYEYTTILSFSIFEKTKIDTYSTTLKEDSYKTGQAIIKQFHVNLKPKLVISFTDGLLINGEDYIEAFTDYDSKLILAGGLAGDNYNFVNTIVFTEVGIIQNGAVVALLDNDSLHITTKASFGWESIGKTMTVTASEKNIVYEIDGKKAVDIYAKYLGDDVAKKLPVTGVEFPLIVQKKGRDTQNIPRAVIARNEDNSLVFAGNIKVGDKVTFGYGNLEAILEYGEKTSTDPALFESEGIFIYSCMARKNLLQNSIGLELFPFSSIAPVSGFFTHGEFYTDTVVHTHELLNQTMTILSLSEGSGLEITKNLPSSNDKRIDRRSRTDLTLKAFSHLISQTSKELEETNRSLEKKVAQEVEKNRLQDKQMLNQSRLAQMGEMISMIAHQWRQPLNAISLTTNNLQLKCMMDEVENDFFEKELGLIDGYSQHLSQTINDFRDFFKENKKKETTNLKKIVENTFSIVQTSLENKNITLVTSLNCSHDIQTYPNEVMQVLLNIIKNAEDILLENKIKNPIITIKTICGIKDLSPASIIIGDNAGGIPEEILSKIFNPYFSTKLEKEGTGLGLYMSKTIIEEHCGGKLTAKNSDIGALFTIELIQNL